MKQSIEMSIKEFEDGVIAQDDDQDYSESGYVAVVKDKQAYIFSYSHCSCYGTWESISKGSESAYDDEVPMRQITPVWSGTINGLVRLAKSTSDPDMPERKVDPENDSDGDHLLKVYEQVVEWDKNRREGK